ncbi:hypothetical protein [Streptomyces sp. NPDC059575]|uniref:hypothetical protein n=1 Tax=Streptomyces sp. NPDC059575 TaxID=3346872 RepID=UPI00369596EA
MPSVFCLASAVVLLPLNPSAAHAATTPGCAPSGDGRSFPLETRIHGGPNSYAAGGDYGVWYIDLTNTTKDTCTGVHPVVVLTDERRVLKPVQPRMDFYDGSRAWPVRFVTTDEQELIGVLEGDGFGGFTVAPGKTVSVKVRLALAPDATPEQVTANAAVVQRKGDDGDWVGESNAYRFGVTEEGSGEEERGEGESPTAPTVPTASAAPTASTGMLTGTVGPGNAETGAARETTPSTANPRTPATTPGTPAPADTHATALTSPGTHATALTPPGTHPALTPAPTLTGTESPGPTVYPTTPRPTPTSKAPGTSETSETSGTSVPDTPSTSDDVTDPEITEDTETAENPEDPEGSEDPEIAADAADAADSTDPAESPAELAATGPTPALPLLAATTVLLALGAVAVLIARRRPRTHPRPRP